MTSPVLADISNFPIQISVSTMNNAYTNSLSITLGDVYISDEATDEIVRILRESYKASAGAALVDDPSTDVIREKRLNISTSSILNKVVQSMTSSTIQSFGNTLITEHMRDESNPFQEGDYYTFPFVIKPGDFSVKDDTPSNISGGMTFFTATVDGKPLLSTPGETVTITDWIYTSDSLNGQYYEGTVNDGFTVNMAIHMTNT